VRQGRGLFVGGLALLVLAACAGRISSSGVDAGIGDGGAERCRIDSDCPQPSTQYCHPCFDGTTSCARARCRVGACVGAPPSCPGPVSNPCASKACGDACQQCATLDGGCDPGYCTWLGACKKTEPVCSIDAGRGCAALDAVGIGDCNFALGWSWTGTRCEAIFGCECVGSDCVLVVPDSVICRDAFFDCSWQQHD
jgi:hypothetical protein